MIKHNKAYWLGKKEDRKEKAKVYRTENKEHYRISRKEYRKSPNGRYLRYRSSAKVRELEFNITFEDFEKIITQPCAYCGEVGLNGVDRVDNKQGYILENCVPCCKTCNMMKWAFTAKDFIKKCRDITEYIT